jgi:hypothetical protein
MSYDNDDPLVSAGLLRGRQLYASRKRAEANLAQYIAEGDQDMIADTLGDIASIDSQGNALNELYRQHTQRAPAPVPQTDGEFMAKAPERMDYSDVQRMASKSKYGAVSDDDMRRNIAELARQKALGKYTDGGN